MKKAIVVVLLVMVGTTLIMAGKDAATPVVGKVNNITFTQPVKIGASIVPPGTYKVQHVMEGQNHIMVFTTKTKGVPEVRVGCKMETLPKRASQTSFVYNKDASGVAVLNRLIFRGDAYAHNF